MKRTERVRLYPNATQIKHLTKMLDITRQIYNAALEQRIIAYKRCGVSITRKMQSHDVTDLRASDPRVASVYRDCEDAAIHRLDLAFAAFFRRVKCGGKAGFPRFRAATRWETMTFSHGNESLKCNFEQTKVRIPGVGSVAMRKGRQIPPYGQARITRRSGRWYATFEYERAIEILTKTGNVVGIDRGVTVAFATSYGEMKSLPATMDERRRHVIVAQRRVCRRKKGGKNRRKAVVILSRAHESVANTRGDFYHKESRKLVDQYDTIVLEKLQVKNMTRSAKGTAEEPGSNVRQKSGLNREILNAGWSIFQKLIVEKAECAARTVIEIDPKNTSRECFACGVVDRDSRRSQSKFVCVACGYEANADVNAARVILKRAKLSPAGSFGALTLGEDPRSALSSGRTRFASSRAAA